MGLRALGSRVCRVEGLQFGVSGVGFRLWF